jgi:D-glycero-D-manno-heptose 1,7-bisphosphate phosphatase
MPRRFAMLDRDGTLIHERHYLSDPDDVELLPGAVEGLLSLRKLGLGLVVLTNQSGVGRGYFDVARLELVHARMNSLLAHEGVELDGIYYCPHRPEDLCPCRKPRAGMVNRAASELRFQPGDGFMIGDKAIDLQLGKVVGATTFLVLTGYGKREHGEAAAYTDYVADDLAQVAEVVASLILPS